MKIQFNATDGFCLELILAKGGCIYLPPPWKKRDVYLQSSNGKVLVSISSQSFGLNAGMGCQGGANDSQRDICLRVSG